MGDDAAAARHLTDAAGRMPPGDVGFAGTLGLVLARLGRHDEARAWLGRAKPGESEFAPSRLELARQLARAGDATGASRALGDAIAAAPDLRARAAADPALAPLLR
jgi:predicted Zn-dependent protease